MWGKRGDWISSRGEMKVERLHKERSRMEKKKHRGMCRFNRSESKALFCLFVSSHVGFTCQVHVSLCAAKSAVSRRMKFLPEGTVMCQGM